VFCVLSDGELDEGTTWEAALFAGARRFANLVAVVDYNKIQSLEPVAAVMDLEPLAEKWRAFGWVPVRCDGHDLDAITKALNEPAGDRPKLVIADTVKGKGVARIENTVESHYRPATDADVSGLAARKDGHA
jgi:transketolase